MLIICKNSHILFQNKGCIWIIYIAKQYFAHLFMNELYPIFNFLKNRNRVTDPRNTNIVLYENKAVNENPNMIE